MDHLEGILFIDHLSKLKRDMVLKKLAKARKGARPARRLMATATRPITRISIIPKTTGRRRAHCATVSRPAPTSCSSAR